MAVGGSPQGRGVVAAASYEARAFGVRSAMPMARALRLCPELRIVPPDFARYKAVSGQVMAILRACTDLVEPLSLDEAYLDVTENRWGIPYASRVARELKARIRAETGCTASAGVAPNKFLAKIASGWRKPDGLTIIAPERVEAFLQDLPVDALWGVGPVTAKKLRSIGVEKLVQLRTADLELLRKTVGSLAGWLVQLAQGALGEDLVALAQALGGPLPQGPSDPLTVLDALADKAPRKAAEPKTCCDLAGREPCLAGGWDPVGHEVDRGEVADRKEGRQLLALAPRPAFGDDFGTDPRRIAQRNRERRRLHVSDSRSPRRA